jgi:type VI secretion system protein ImpJ
MTWRTKVVWSEGLLQQSLHLRQSERHAGDARRLLLRTATPCAWGFAELGEPAE